MKLAQLLEQQKATQRTTQRTLAIITTFAIKYASPQFQVSPTLSKTIQAFFTASDHLHPDEPQSAVDRALKHLRIPAQNFTHINVPICLLPHLYPSWFDSEATIRPGASPITVGLVKSPSPGGIDGFALAWLQFSTEENHYTLDMCCYPQLQAFRWTIDNDSWRIERELQDPSSEWFTALRVRDEAFEKAADNHFVPARLLMMSHWTRESDDACGSDSEALRIYLRELASDGVKPVPSVRDDRRSISRSDTHHDRDGSAGASRRGHAVGLSSTTQYIGDILQSESRHPHDPAEEIPTEHDQDDQASVDKDVLPASKADKKREAQRLRRMKKRKLRSEFKAGDLDVADLMELMKQVPQRC